jgi:hypothetical protein
VFLTATANALVEKYSLTENAWCSTVCWRHLPHGLERSLYKVSAVLDAWCCSLGITHKLDLFLKVFFYYRNDGFPYFLLLTVQVCSADYV